MNETVANGFMWWGIIVSAFWFIWVTLKAMSVSELEDAVQQHYRDLCKLQNRVEELEKKGKTK